VGQLFAYYAFGGAKDIKPMKYYIKRTHRPFRTFIRVYNYQNQS